MIVEKVAVFKHDSTSTMSLRTSVITTERPKQNILLFICTKEDVKKTQVWLPSIFFNYTFNHCLHMLSIIHKLTHVINKCIEK